jgi:N-methylhydantoinase A/oxoprolinase/acetone carboxylase beta subunit
MRFPEALGTLLRSIAELERLPEYRRSSRFAIPIATPRRICPRSSGAVWERSIWSRAKCRRSCAAAPGLEALRRLADAGLATIAAFTPSDAMHVLDRQERMVREAALWGAHSRDRGAQCARRGRRRRAAAICERTYEHVVRETAALCSPPRWRTIPASKRTPRLGRTRRSAHRGFVAGRRFSTLVQATLGLARPLIAIGAPVGAYYPEVARRLGARSPSRTHAAVCNAVGAVAGVVSQTVEILVNQPTFKVFRVHDPAGSRDYPDPEPALEHARRASRELALAAARRAGAADPHVETSVVEKLAQVGPGADYLAEAVARSVGHRAAARGHRAMHAPRRIKPYDGAGIGISMGHTENNLGAVSIVAHASGSGRA